MKTGAEDIDVVCIIIRACWLFGGLMHILSMPDISSEASDVLFCSSLPLVLVFCFACDGFTGDENNPVISSSPFSSNLA
jgi:hypothetical protein